jgi:hypothetical protein
MKKAHYAVIACLLLSVSASACEFPAGVGYTVESVAVTGGTTDIDEHRGNPQGNPDDPDRLPVVPLQATPELDSLALFGSGLLAAGTYLRRRVLAARRPV